MKVLIIFPLAFLLVQALYGVYIIGFPDYVKHPNLSYWESLFHSGFIEPYGRIAVGAIISYLIYAISKPYIIEKFLVSELTYGTIKSVKYSNIRVNNKPLIDLEVDYMGINSTFRDQPGDFGFEFKQGDLIPVKYQKNKPERAIIPGNAVEISKEHVG